MSERDEREEKELWAIVRRSELDLARHDERMKNLEGVMDDLKKGQKAVETKLETVDSKINKLTVKVIAAVGAIQTLIIFLEKVIK